MTWVGPRPVKSVSCSERQHGTILWKRSERRRIFLLEEKLFQRVAARFNFLAMDRSDLLYSVKELTRKMASPRIQDLTALMRVARYTIKYSRMTCSYAWAELDSNIEVFGDAKLCGMQLHEKIHSGGVAMWSGRSVKVWSKTVGVLALSSGVRIGSGGGSGDRSDGTAVDFERPLFVWSFGDLSLTQLQHSGWSGSD